MAKLEKLIISKVIFSYHHFLII